MLRFKFLSGLKFFEPVWFLFSFVSDYGNELDTKEDKKLNRFKNFNQKKNLNHNTDIDVPQHAWILIVNYLFDWSDNNHLFSLFNINQDLDTTHWH